MSGFQGLTTASSGTLGATPTSGNVLFSVLFLDAQPHTVTMPSGWTNLAELNYAAGGYHVRVDYKLCGGSESTSYTWSWTGNSFSQAVYLAEWTGNDATTAIDVSDSAWNDFGFNPGSPIAVPSITTVTNDAVHIIVVNNQAQNNGYTPPSGYNEEQDDVAFGVFSKTYTSAGATGSQSVGCNGTFWYETFSFAIRPSGGGGGGSIVPVLMRQYRQRWS